MSDSVFNPPKEIISVDSSPDDGIYGTMTGVFDSAVKGVNSLFTQSVDAVTTYGSAAIKHKLASNMQSFDTPPNPDQNTDYRYEMGENGGGARIPNETNNTIVKVGLGIGATLALLAVVKHVAS